MSAHAPSQPDMDEVAHGPRLANNHQVELARLPFGLRESVSRQHVEPQMAVHCQLLGVMLSIRIGRHKVLLRLQGILLHDASHTRQRAQRQHSRGCICVCAARHDVCVRVRMCGLSSHGHTCAHRHGACMCKEAARATYQWHGGVCCSDWRAESGVSAARESVSVCVCVCVTSRGPVYLLHRFTS